MFRLALGAVAVALAALACGTSSDLFSGGTGGSGTTTSSAPGGTGQGGSADGGGGSGATAGAGQGGDGVGGEAAGGSGAGGNAPVPCTWGQTDCGPGHYCQAPGCTTGFCEPGLPPGQQLPGKDPACGCDGVVYWNASIAESQGMSVRHAGACNFLEDVGCSQQNPCPGGKYCNHREDTQFTCNVSFGGQCWAVPVACPPGGPSGVGCLGAAQCVSECALIQSQNPWYPSANCP